MLKTKFKAFLIHLALSIVVVSLIMGLIIYFWFPSPFLGLSDFKEISVILIAVDLVLGPLLTFVAFNPKKKSLKLDLSLIAGIQVAALGYGAYMLFLSHPVYITYFGNQFNLVPAKQAKPHQAKYPSLKVSKLSAATLAFMNTPDKETRDILFTKMLNGGSEIEANSEYYEPFENHLLDVITNSLDPSIIFKNSTEKNKLNSFLSENGQSQDDYIFVTLSGSTKKTVWALDKKTGKPIDTIDVKPIISAKNE